LGDKKKKGKRRIQKKKDPKRLLLLPGREKGKRNVTCKVPEINQREGIR